MQHLHGEAERSGCAERRTAAGLFPRIHIGDGGAESAGWAAGEEGGEERRRQERCGEFHAFLAAAAGVSVGEEMERGRKSKVYLFSLL